MPTDKQRGRFHVWRGRYFDEIDLSLMTPTETAAYKSAFQAGLQARDAEVQALREALTYALHVLEHLKADNPNPLLPNARWRSVDMARAALAGETGSSDD